MGFSRSVAAVVVTLAALPMHVWAQKYEVRDSAGVEIVESGPGQRTGGTWSLNPSLSIGAVDGAEPYLFSHVWDALLLSGGGVVVVDAQAYEIRVFDQSGRHQRSFGRRGGGPEEFGGPPWVELSSADTLLVWDPGHHRFSTYDLHGNLLGQETIRERVLDLGIMLFPNGRVWATGPSSSVLWTGPETWGREEGLNTQYRRLIRIDQDGSHVDLGRRVAGQVYLLSVSQGGFRGIPNSFSGAAVAELGPANETWVSDAERYEIRTYGADGSLTRILRVDIPRLPVTRDYVAQARGQLPEMAHGLGVPLRRLEAAFDDIPTPDSVPAIASLHRGAGGEMWVGRRRGPGHWTRRPVAEYDVFAPDGQWLATVSMPDDVTQLLSADRDYIVVTAMDDLEVQYVRTYKLRRNQ